MSVKNRIKEFCKYSKMPVTEFEKSLLVANGYVNSISKSIGIDKIELLLEIYPNLNIEWLLAGKGSMLKGNLNEENNLQDSTNYKELAEARLELIEMLKEKVSKLNNDVIELASKKEYGSSVQRGAVEFLNEPQLGGISGKKG